ncbi:MAG: metal-dependent transcriptional regulator [Anaerolineaceae bacterium]|nr:metal-dependent transcriptional regulator [Anaerolineaceae bacterium]
MPDISDLTHSESVQNFLKAVYALQQNGGRVSTNALADTLNVKAPSITDMAQRLMMADLVDYERYKGVMLTSSGEALALKIIRRHRLIELYLVEELGYALQDVHIEAEALEHAVSDHFVKAIAAKLGDPELDPHGDPIPSADGTIIRRNLSSLTDWPLATAAQVCRIKTSDSDMLQHILDRGFKLNTSVTILSRDPFEGPLTVQVDGEARVIGYRAALCILVAPPEES